MLLGTQKAERGIQPTPQPGGQAPLDARTLKTMNEPLSTPSIREELVAIIEMSKLLEKPLDPGHTIEGILRLLSQLCGLNCGRVSLPNEVTGVVEVKYHYGLWGEDVTRGRYDVGANEGVTGRVMRTGITGLVPDVGDDPIFLQRIAEKSGVASDARLAFIAVPIMESGTPIGVLSAQREASQDRSFNFDISLLRVASSMIGQVLRIDSFVAEQTHNLRQENQSLKNTLTAGEMVNNSVAHGIIGTSPALFEAVKQANQVADTDAPVLLKGESGTGKEKFARMIHQQSNRREQPFISINCSAVPMELQEAELFGYRKGSFSGATASKAGKVQLADGGTLFLDEIGDMPLTLQAKLLRTIQEKKVDPIGATESESVDFRLICATHAPLAEMVNQGSFRLDLFYRINVVPIELPALRSRDGDIRRIALHHLNELNHAYDRNAVLSHDALALLEEYAWPGNVRQLVNVLERATVMTGSGIIDDGLVRYILGNESAVQPPGAVVAGGRDDRAGSDFAQLDQTVDGVGIDGGIRRYEWVRQEEARVIREALAQTNGNRTKAAEMLNLTVRQLRYRITKLDLDKRAAG